MEPEAHGIAEVFAVSRAGGSCGAWVGTFSRTNGEILARPGPVRARSG
jgi:hypothetical protein